VRIETTVDLLGDSHHAPELMLWLGAVSVMNERQFDTFRQVLVAGPTVNTHGLVGNDLPALFFHDPRTRIQTMIYTPADDVTWSARRFLDYRCGTRVERSSRRYGVGLIHTSPDCSLLAGSHRFVWFVRQQYAATAPTEWEAQAMLIHALAPLFGRSNAPPPSWQHLAAGALDDLLTPGDGQITVHGFLGHPSYVRDTSEIREEDRRPRRFELMTHIDVVPPLALYLQLHPDLEATRHLTALTETLALFHHADAHWLSNFYPARGGLWIEDLWYFFENALIKLPWTAAITGDDELWAVFIDALIGATELAHSVQYIFPLFADVRSREPYAAATNYSVGGMYAYAHLLAHAHTGAQAHLDEAHAALATLAMLPIDRMWHEPQQLGFAAAAATLLSQRGEHPTMRALAENLLATQLRMVYWSDRSTNGNSITGMFQACASLLYPAFKENVESILPWPLLLRAQIGDATLLLRIIDAQRRNCGAYFDAIRSGITCPSAFIPYENLGTVELPEEGAIGKEVYGVGEVFWLYLLVEALGHADDPEVLVCSLDLPALDALASFPPTSREFMLLNATETTRNITVTVPVLPDGRYAAQWGAHHRKLLSTVEGAIQVTGVLRPGEVANLSVAPSDPEREHT
jgi:hypothetical protein